MQNDIKLFYAVEDYFPPWRVDLVELFVHQLARQGVQTTWSFRREEPGRCQNLALEGQTACLPLGFGRRNLILSALNVFAQHVCDLGLFLGWIWKPHFEIFQARDRRYFMAFLTWLAARLLGAKFVYWLSFPFPENWLEKAEQYSGLKAMAYRFRGYCSKWYVYGFLMMRSDHVFVQSDQMREDVVAYGVPRGKMTPVPMGFSPDAMDRFGQLETRTTIDGLVVYLGTLAKARRIETVLEAFALVRERVPYARLLIVGEGDTPSERQDLENLSVKLEIDNAVHFTGFVPMEQAWQHIQEAQVCVSPFYPTFILRSCSPTKLIEYMAFSKPVVANDHPDQSRVLSDSGAGICVPWSVEAFANAIVHLLLHPDRAREMGRRGPGWVRANRTYDKLAHSVVSQYRTLLEEV